MPGGEGDDLRPAPGPRLLRVATVIAPFEPGRIQATQDPQPVRPGGRNEAEAAQDDHILELEQGQPYDGLVGDPVPLGV
ncbi:hypothetical protein AQJ91_13535 [Streptomyces dysideae]|uniref:Uncharacterized protein n=1 Tax=Streptomyces dysideae TaxID=909626 RepID=A0A101V149_9ACTN|nr:hypothetical protein AQJ91_13535 [Streptomyces dysideae]